MEPNLPNELGNVQSNSASFGTVPQSAEHFRNVPNDSEAKPSGGKEGETEAKALRLEVLDLKITNRAKDMFIEQLQKERESFALERRDYVDRLVDSNRRVGELEAALRQLSSPEHKS